MCVPVLLYQGLILALPVSQNWLAGVPSLASGLFASFGCCLCWAAGGQCSLPPSLSPTVLKPIYYKLHLWSLPSVPSLTLAWSISSLVCLSTFFHPACLSFSLLGQETPSSPSQPLLPPVPAGFLALSSAPGSHCGPLNTAWDLGGGCLCALPSLSTPKPLSRCFTKQAGSLGLGHLSLGHHV